MATVFETRLIGNIGKNAVVREMDKGIIAINFPVAHNKNWRDKRTGEQKTKTTWVNCTIWKKEGSSMRIIDFLTKGTLVELVGSPFAKGYIQDDNSVKTEIRLNVAKTNILRPGESRPKKVEVQFSEEVEDSSYDTNYNNASADNFSSEALELEESLFN